MENKLIQKKTLLINNNASLTLYEELMDSLNNCEGFIFNVAFITFSGIQTFINTFTNLKKKGVKGKILTSTYLDFTDPKSLHKILEFDNIELRLYDNNKERGFHNKGYIFDMRDHYKIIIGSSNFTANALKSNIEWNVRLIVKKEDDFFFEVMEEFNEIWDMLDTLDEALLNVYTWKYEQIKAKRKKLEKVTVDEENKISSIKVVPNLMQKQAMKNLASLRAKGEDKALVIAATGSGKTYMAAFDVEQYQPKKALFIVHRENILESAISTFRSVLGIKYKYSKLSGNSKDPDGDIVFAMNKSIINYLHYYGREYFDYIIIDEAHHSTASTYQQVLNHFNPKFLLGMTATPERGDQSSVFEIFDHNIALELRLNDAIDNNLIVPFHYYGVTDIDSVDLSGIEATNISEISKRLMVHSRTHYIISQMNKFGHDTDHLKGLGFCVDIQHAEFMTKEFNEAGIPSICLTGRNSTEERSVAFQRLESNTDKLQMIFSVDLLNEGIDIPSVNLVLMLRPTESPIIFLQQLGRGLRHYEGKQFLTVLDFIANYDRSFLLALALTGNQTRDKDSILVQVKKDFRSGPKRVFIQMEEIIKEQIIDQLKKTNFNTLKFLREEYDQFKATRLALINTKDPVPYYLMDYYAISGAPDPLRYITYNKNSYLEFLSQVERDNDYIKSLILDKNFEKILRTISKQLPLVRAIDFLILKFVLEHEVTNKNELESYLLDNNFLINKAQVDHSLRYLNFEFEDSSGLSAKTKFIELENENITLTNEAKAIKQDATKLSFVKDVIDYGLINYFNEFGYKDFGDPFLKIGAGYSMLDVALASNVTNKLSSFRGSGVIPWQNHMFLFVDLHKEADIEESINYKDKIISKDHIQWQSQNKTTQNSKSGRKIINHKEENVLLHMFVRKQKEVDGIVLPYTYLGLVDVMSYEGDKPITFQFKLRNPLSEDDLIDFVTKV